MKLFCISSGEILPEAESERVGTGGAAGFLGVDRWLPTGEAKWRFCLN